MAEIQQQPEQAQEMEVQEQGQFPQFGLQMPQIGFPQANFGGFQPQGLEQLSLQQGAFQIGKDWGLEYLAKSYGRTGDISDW